MGECPMFAIKSRPTMGVTKAEGLTEYEFMRESMNAAAQMGAQGSGLVLLIVSVISGILHDKFREVFIRALTDDSTWQAVTCWTKWVGTDPSRFTDAEKKLAVKDAKPWNTVWLKFAKDLVAELYPSENGATVDVSKALVKYGNFAKRKKVLNIDANLLEETEQFSILKSCEVTMRWQERRKTRNHLLLTYYGPLIVSFLPELETCADITAWDQCFKSKRSTLDQFITTEIVKQPSPESPNERKNKPNRLEERKRRDTKYERKMQDLKPAIKLPQQEDTDKGCFECGGPHWVRDCPRKATSPLRRSQRLSKDNPTISGKQVKFAEGTKHERTRFGLLGRASQEDSSGDDADIEAYQSPSESDYMSDSHQSSETEDDQVKEEVSEETAKKKLGCFACHPESKVRTVKVLCNGRQLRFGLDSGLDVSLIKRDHVSRYDLRTPANIVLEGLGGDLRIKELVECVFPFGKHHLGITDKLPFDGLLGIDILEKMELSEFIEFKTAEASIEGTWQPMFVRADGPLSETELRSAIGDLRLPILDCAFDSFYPNVRIRGRPTPIAWRNEAEKLIWELQEDGVLKEVEPDSIGWISPGVFVPKTSENGELKLRFVIDLKVVNKRVIKPHTATYPHSASNVISQVNRNSRWFAKVDIKNAFFNLPLADNVKRFLRTSVVLGGSERVFELQKAPQGFSESPLWWCDFIDEVLRSFRNMINGHREKSGNAIAYVDDILVFSEHETSCSFVFAALLQFLQCLGIPFGKTVEPCEEVKLIGLIFSRNGVRISVPTSMKDLKVPTDQSSLRTAMGVFQYVRSGYHQKTFLENVSVLSRLLRKNTEFLWDERAQSAWKWLTENFENVYFQYFSQHDQLSDNECFIIQTDASDAGIACALWLSDMHPEGEEIGPEWFNSHAKLLSTSGRIFSQEEINYPTWDKESLSIFEALVMFGDMTMCAMQTEGQLWVISDSKAAIQRWDKVLSGGMIDEHCTSGSRSRRWSRWVDDLSLILLSKPRFVHIPGERNQVADFFSRALKQVMGEVRLRGYSGTRVDQPAVETVRPNPFYSELLTQIRTLTFSEDNDDKYQGRLIRDILLEEDDSSSFRNIDGLAYFCTNATKPRLYVPKGRGTLGDSDVDIRVALIAMGHQAHEGIERTTSNLSQYYWPRMTQNISAFIRSCLHCQRKNIKANFGRLTGRSVPSRFQRIVIDHATPSQPGINPHGHMFRHVLVICDSFTRYVRMIPVHSTETRETVEHLLQWSLTFGFPRELVADNFSGLRNLLIEKALSITSRSDQNLNRWIAPVMYPQSQGEAERVIRELKSYIQTRADNKWPDVMDFLAFAHNSAPYGSTGICPHEMVLGEEPTKLVDLMSWPTTENLPPTIQEFMENLKSRMKDQQELYQLKMEEYRTISRDRYNSAHPTLAIKIGDLVWVVKKTPFKVDVQGPATVTKLQGDHFYMVKLDEEEKLVPMQHIVPFVSPDSVDRSGISFAQPPEDNMGWPELLRIPRKNLSNGDLVLIQREQGTDDIIEYDIAEVVTNNITAELIRVELMTVEEASSKWVKTGLQYSYPYRMIVGAGFRLNRHRELRATTLREWRALGIVE